MANKKNKRNVANMQNIDVARVKWGKNAYYILIGLIISIPFCLVCGWLSGNTELTKISDNVVTALIQNYNYILGTFVLIPVIAYIYSKIKEELNRRLISDSSIVSYRVY